MVTLRGFPAYFVFLGRHLPPVRQVTALPAVELHRNVVVAAWTGTSVVRLGFHCVGPLLQVCLRRSQYCYLAIWANGSFMIFAPLPFLDRVPLKTNSNQDAS